MDDFDMPSITLQQQKGNSCAAHCVVIALAELKRDASIGTRSYAENFVWPFIQFKGDDNLTKNLADEENSDPRLIVSIVERSYPFIDALLTSNNIAKNMALACVNTPHEKEYLSLLFDLITKHANACAELPSNTLLRDNVYYIATYLMLDKPSVQNASVSGLHNILLTKYESGNYYYNSNELFPCWKKLATPEWWVLENQNDGENSYIFTGVCVEMKRKQ